jgi:Cellulose biosynthesis protein BcsQ
MFVVCWSVKGGSGTSVVAASLGLLAARRDGAGALIVDLAGDMPDVLAVAHSPGQGVHDWLRADSDIGPEALDRLTVRVTDRLDLLPAGTGWGYDTVGSASAPAPPASTDSTPRWARLAGWLATQQRAIIVDCHGVPPPALSSRATISLLVIRQCYLATAKAARIPMPPSTALVLVTEPGRALRRRDIEAALGVPVIAEIPLDPAIARAIDAGLLGVRLPGTISRPLAQVA